MPTPIADLRDVFRVARRRAAHRPAVNTLDRPGRLLVALAAGWLFLAATALTVPALSRAMDVSLGRSDYAVAFVLFAVATVVQIAGLIALAVAVLVSADLVLERLGIPSTRPWLVLAVAPAPAPAATPSAAQETPPHTAARPPYEALLAHVLETGRHGGDRTGTGTTSVFGAQLRFDLAAGFPLITAKHVSFRNVALELLWMLRGDMNVRWLQDRNVSIWDEWADENGDLGPAYGAMWRSWPTTDGGALDQVRGLIDGIRANPEPRRHIITAWNPELVDTMALPPCHAFVQFHVRDGKLSCQLYQRSADLFLGMPCNIASYALLTHLIAAQTGYEVGDFVWTGGDCHIYDNHRDQVREQLTREPFPLPTLTVRDGVSSIFEYTFEDFDVSGYERHPAIRAAVAV